MKELHDRSESCGFCSLTSYGLLAALARNWGDGQRRLLKESSVVLKATGGTLYSYNRGPGWQSGVMLDIRTEASGEERNERVLDIF